LLFSGQKVNCEKRFMDPNIKITTGNLVLRPLEFADADYFLAYLQGIDRYLSLIAPKTIDEAKALVQEKLDEVASGKAVYFAITIKSTGEFIGLCGVFNIGTDVVNRHCWIRKDFQGKGFAYETITALMEWVNQTIDYDVIYSAFDDQNSAMKKLNQKLGGIPGPEKGRPVRQESGKILSITYYTYPNPKKQNPS
jgi:RimJ/RimL family protein N-acetyltransferase